MQNNFNESPKFRGEILRQVYRVWLFRKFLPVLIAEIIVISLILYKLSQTIFIEKFIGNAIHVFLANPPKIFSFFISAFSQALVITKVLSIVLLILVALFLRLVTQGILRFILVRENYFSRIRKNE